MSAPAVAVAIPARNAQATLGACIAALRGAGLAAEAIVVADDRSSDDSAAIARALGARVLGPGGPAGARAGGAAAARNRAAAAAPDGTEILLFVDADVAVHGDAIDRVRAAFAADPGLDALFGAYDTAPPAPGVVSRYRNLLHHWVHRHGPREPSTFWTGLGAVRRRSFVAAGGFDASHRMMEDIEFGLRLKRAGGRIRLDPALQGTHLKRWSLWSMIRSDLFDRAIPWTRLMLFGDGLIAELNLAPGHRASAALAALAAVSIPAAVLEPRALGLGAAAALGFVLLNARFLRFLASVGGIGFAAAAVPAHMIHYLCALAGFGWVLTVEHWPRRLRRALRRRPG